MHNLYKQVLESSVGNRVDLGCVYLCVLDVGAGRSSRRRRRPLHVQHGRVWRGWRAGAGRLGARLWRARLLLLVQVLVDGAGARVAVSAQARHTRRVRQPASFLRPRAAIIAIAAGLCLARYLPAVREGRGCVMGRGVRYSELRRCAGRVRGCGCGVGATATRVRLVMMILVVVLRWRAAVLAVLPIPAVLLLMTALVECAVVSGGRPVVLLWVMIGGGLLVAGGQRWGRGYAATTVAVARRLLLLVMVGR